MKILWVEDFNAGRAKSVSKPLYKNYFGWNESDMILVESLGQALDHIRKNPNSFDLVLLDIDLQPSKEENRDTLYKDYFDGVTTKTFFDKHLKENDGGLLLFLYLREHVNFPKNRIAFLSAYVGEQDPLDMTGTGVYDYDDEDDFFGSAEPSKENTPEETSEKTGERKETLEIFELFDSLGIPVTHLYQKPQGSDNENKRKKVNAEKFNSHFIEGNKTDYILFRRRIMEMAQILMDTFCEHDDPDATLPSNGVVPIKKFVHILHKPDEKGGELKTFFNITKSTKDIGKGTEVYNQDYFYSLLEKTMDLPLIVNSDAETTLLTYMRDMLFCADCFAIPQRNSTEDKTPIFDLAAANVLAKARNGLSHGSASENLDYVSGLLELKSFLIPLFLRTVFNIDMISEEKRTIYLKREQEMICTKDISEFQTNEVIFETVHSKALDLFLDLFHEINAGIKSGKKGWKNHEKTTNIFTVNVDTPLLHENTKGSFGQFFLTRLLPDTRSLLGDGKDGKCTVKLSLDNNLDQFPTDSMEYRYIQKAFELGFQTRD